ncbi:trehalose-6-phosphate synthase [Chloroflexota bacterium]
MATGQHGNALRLKELCHQRLASRRLILASNRGPIEYHLTEDGQLQARRGSGGVVTALSSLSEHIELDWIASAMREGDREAARRAQGGRFRVPLGNEKLSLHFVVSPRDTYHKFYSVICNPLLWFLQHYMWNSARTPNIDHRVYDAWENGYVTVNQAFAQAVVDEVKGKGPLPIVMLHDYHLYLASTYIRQQVPGLVIQQFTHIPWPSPPYWQLLPGFMRRAIFQGLCNADIVGLQTGRDVYSFLHGCESFLDEAEVDYRQRTVHIGDHIVQVKAYPVSVDVAELKKTISSAKFRKYKEKLSSLCGEQTIVRVDRLEPSKNIIRGLRAFDTLLERYPQFLGKVKLLAFLVPSRTHLRPYQRYAQEVFQLIESINNKYQTGEWHPVDFFHENDYIQALAGMSLYDVLLVNAVIDGMNLVAKEGPTVNSRNGVLILSESVGACEQLGENALTVASADLEGTTQALYTALTMPAEERRRRATALRRSIEEEDVTNWLLRMLEDIVNLIERRSGTSTSESAPHHLLRSR